MADTNEPDNRTLADRIRAMLSAEFDGLNPEAVASVLSGIASELVQHSEAGVSSISEMRQASSVWDESLAAPMIVTRAGVNVSVAATERSDVEKFINELLNVGAIMLPMENPPGLNEELALVVRFPSLHLDIRTAGRVVHVSPQGVAIDLGTLNKEDRAALESVWEDMNRGVEKDVSEPDALDIKKTDPNIGQTVHARPGFRATESVPIPSFGRRPDTQFRRRVDLTDPDVKVISSTQMGGKSVHPTREFYGPAIREVVPVGELERDERLADDRILDILLQLSQDATTGMAEIEYTSEGKSVTRQLLLDGGLIVEISRIPRDADEELGPMLYRADRITKQQLAMAAAHSDENGGTIERSLLDLGILEPDRIRQSIAGRLTYLMRELMEVRDGVVRVYDSSALPAGFLPAPPLRVHMALERELFRRLFEEARQRPLKERERQLLDFLDTYPEIVPGERDRVDRTLQEQTHLSLVENVLTGRKRLKEVFTESTLSHAETYAIIQSLHRMGLLRFDRSLHQTVVRERYRENVTVKYLSVHKASYFEVLNVHWSSYDDGIEKAYQELIQQFDPASVPESMESEVHQRVSEIRDRIESAYQVLARRDTRHAYRKRIMPEYKLTHAIPLFLKQSELAERRRQWVDAKDALNRVLEIDPTHKSASFKSERIDAIIDNRLSPDALDSNF